MTCLLWKNEAFNRLVLEKLKGSPLPREDCDFAYESIDWAKDKCGETTADYQLVSLYTPVICDGAIDCLGVISTEDADSILTGEQCKHCKDLVFEYSPKEALLSGREPPSSADLEAWWARRCPR